MILNKLFLNAGAMKAGTTWLYSILREHPDLYFTYEKEIHFWSDYTLHSNTLSAKNRIQKAKTVIGNNQNEENIRKFEQLVQWYAKFLAKDINLQWYADLFSFNRKAQAYNCDFSNLTCHMNDEGWKLVRHVAKEVKVIYILRDPVSRLWSHIKFHHQFVGQQEDFTTWSAGKFEAFISSHFIWPNCEYARWIDIMKRNLSEDEFKIFYFEDLVSRPVQELRKLEDFLGISNMDYSKLELDKPINASKKIEMPEAFTEVALKMLLPEMEKLDNIQVKRHESWLTNALTT